MAVGIKPLREAPNIFPKMTMARKTPMHSPPARFSRDANMGSKLIEGVGWNSMLVFSPWMGTSDVDPGASGSGGAVMSWLWPYSGLDCEASVLIVASLPRFALGTDS